MFLVRKIIRVTHTADKGIRFHYDYNVVQMSTFLRLAWHVVRITAGEVGFMETIISYCPRNATVLLFQRAAMLLSWPVTWREVGEFVKKFEDKRNFLWEKKHCLFCRMGCANCDLVSDIFFKTCFVLGSPMSIKRARNRFRNHGRLIVP